MPQSFISGLKQDADGFLWIGTRDGLARYDGREFRVFRHNNNDSTSLSSNVIIDLYLDPLNLLWVIYVNQKLDCFDPRRLQLSYKNSFPQLQNLLSKFNVEKFIRDHSGRFWLNTNYQGIISFDPASKKITQFNTANQNLKSNNNLGVIENTKGRICVFTDKGLEILNKQGAAIEEFISFPSSLNFKFIYGAHNKVACLPDGSLLLTNMNRLIRYDPVMKSFASIPLPPAVPPEKDIIHHLQVGKDSLLYIEAAGGVYRLEKNFTLTYLWKYPSANPVENYSISFLVDHSQVIWFGTNAAGLCKIDLQALPFMASVYKNNFHSDVLSRLPSLSFEKIPSSLQGGKWSYGLRYCYGPTHNLALTHSEKEIAEENSLAFTYNNGRLLPLPVPKGNHQALRGLSFSPSGILYGVDLAGNIWRWHSIDEMPDSIASILSLKAGHVVDMEADDKILWISTDKEGLYKIEHTTLLNNFQKGNSKKDLPTNQLTDLCKDPSDPDILWIGTLGQGLIRWNKSTGTEKIYTTSDGFPNNTIYSIAPDEEGNLWISTNKGICRFNLKTKNINNFDVTDGLIGNEFNRFHHLRLPDGQIAFGGLEGYTIFDPKTFTPDTFPTPVAFTKLFINNVATDLVGNQKNSAGINQLPELVLPYNKNFLSFEYAGLQLNQPGKIHYRYKLKGYDKDWIDAGTRNLATYTRLPPGKYTLLTNASNTSGKWSPFIKQLAIRIRPPLWATWWAYAIYALVIATLFRSYWKYRVNRIRMQNEIVLEQNKALHLQEVDEIKNRFFDNITHEFRTPLTLILTPLEKLSRDNSLSASHQHVLSNAHRNAGQLLRLINQLLDISKIESGQMKINLSAGELDEFVKRCIEQFSLQAKEKNIRLSFLNEGVSGHYNFDEEKWEKIILNLLSNAIKFTPDSGKITVSLKSKKDPGISQTNIELTVEDSGVGIPQEKLSKIFDRFYMADDSGTRSHSGTGIGLSLAKELIQLMNGSIHVKSESGKGTAFAVIIPIERIETAIEIKDNVEEIMAPFSARPTGGDFVSEEITEGPLLLVVEDNDELRSFISESLAAHWRVLEASNGKIAWEIILKELPEIVVSDIMMPEMDGVELCGVSKNDARTEHISFILLTAKAAHQSKLTGLEAGADEYITKPFHFDELELRIHNLIQQQERWRKHLQKQLLPEKPLPKLPHVNDIFIQKLYKELDERIDESGMDVETLAKLLNMSRRTLNRKLNALLNISPNDLIRRYRLQKAASLIASGHSITQTAYTVGFETPSYFTQCFKEQYGLTPSEFASQKTA